MTRIAGPIASLIAGLVVVLTACAEHSTQYPGPPELTLGFGEHELVMIHDGDPVPITTGPQGGVIVWGAASVRYLDPVELDLVFTIEPPGGAPSVRRVRADLHDADGGFAVSTTFGHPVFLPDEEQFQSQPCVWRLEARDRAGRSAIDEKSIVPTRGEQPSRSKPETVNEVFP
jgi:hypothetical protein